MPTDPDDTRITAAQLQCMTTGHWWDNVPAPPWASTSYTRAIWFRCTTCERYRHDALDNQGEVIYRRYWSTQRWVDGVTSRENGVRRSDLRKVRFADLLAKAEAEEARKRNLIKQKATTPDA